MSTRVSTKKLKDAVNQAFNAAGKKPAIPITEYLTIKVEDGKLNLVVTDGNAYTQVTIDAPKADDLLATVDIRKFSALVKRTTAEHIILSMVDDHLKVYGNGSYKLAQPVDEDKYVFEVEMPETPEPVVEGVINADDFTRALVITRPAVATDVTQPELVGFYLDKDRVAGTDSLQFSLTKVKGVDTPLLIPVEMVNAVMVMRDNIDYKVYPDSMVGFETPAIKIVGRQLEGIEDYPIEGMTAIYEKEFEGFCRVDRREMLDALGRVNLFVEAYDMNAVTLTFGENQISLSSKDSAGSDTVAYQRTDKQKYIPFSCRIDVTSMIKLVTAQDGDTLHVSYGDERVIRMDNGDTTQFLALVLEDE